jgi:arylsulfatase A-like enzyme
MLTSVDPRVHGTIESTKIPDAITTLAEVLVEHGWNTAGFVDTAYLGRKYGFDRGFFLFDDEKPPPGNYRWGAAARKERVIDWMTALDERPSFVFWHIMDVHGPYGARTPHGGRYRAAVVSSVGDQTLEPLRKLGRHAYLDLERFDSLDDLIASYDEGIRAVDAVLGEFFQFLQSRREPFRSRRVGGPRAFLDRR